MGLRPATADDWIAMFGTAEPGDWFGLAASTDWLVKGIGVVYRDSEDRWWLGLARAPGIVETRTAHAGAKRLMAMADERGLTLNAMCDPAFEGTARWLKRLGFKAGDETRGGIAVWTR